MIQCSERTKGYFAQFIELPSMFILNGGKNTFQKCDICNKQCKMEDYKNHIKSKIYTNILEKLKEISKYCDICKDDFNNSDWNKRVKKHEAVKTNKKIEMFFFYCFFPLLLTCYLLQYRL